MAKVMLILINKGDLAYKNIKNVIKKSLYQFDELYYMKILRIEILKLMENYYLRAIKIISKLRDIQFIFDDRKLNSIMDLVEYDPELLKIYNDNIKKEENDIFMIINDGKHLISRIGEINTEMTKNYLNKVYFKKMQKMVQISRLPDTCLILLNKIYDYIRKKHGIASTVLGSENNNTNRKPSHKEISQEIRDLFFELKRFFVLQMIKSDYNVIGDCETLRDQCIDVFIEYGFECDDLIIELNQYLDINVIKEELKVFFRYMEKINIFNYFDHINHHDIDKISKSSSSLNLECKITEQYFNILRHLTFYPDQEIKVSFQNQIINNILQTDLMKKISDKDFVKNFCSEVKKKIPQVQNRMFSFNRIMRGKSIDQYSNK
jgi:hypothetical protein